MKKLLPILALLLASATAQAAAQTFPQITTQKLTFNGAPAPQPVSQATVQLVGNPGNQTYYVWIVANFAVGNATPSQPFMIRNAPVALSASNYLFVSWSAITGATGYDVLLTTTDQTPSGACGCAAATGVTGTTENITSSTTSAYTVNTYSGSPVFELDNLAGPLVFRYNAGEIAHLTAGGTFYSGANPLSGISGSATTGDCVDFASATTIQDAGAPCGSGGGGVILQTNGTNNASQSLLNLVAGTGITLANTSGGDVSVATAALPVVTPEAYGAKGNGGFYYDGAITPPSMPAGSAIGSSTTPTTPSVTTPAANSLVVFAGLGNAAWTTNMTGTNQVAQTFSVGNYAINASTEIVAASGSAVSGSGTLGSSSPWIASAVALGPGSSSIAAVGAWTNAQTASTTTLTVTTPAGVTAGDMLIAVIDWYNYTLTTPTGWTQLTTTTDSNNDKQALYYYIAGSSTPSSFTWTSTGSGGMAGAMGAYSGVNTASVLTSATAAFASADVSDPICTAATGAGGVQQCGTIQAFTSSTQVSVSYIATASASSLWFTYGTDDSSAFSTMLTTAPCSTVGCKVELQPHEYVLTSAITLPNDRTIQIIGAGYGLGNTENSYLNSNTPPNANMGTRLDWATTSLTQAAVTFGAVAGITSTTAFDVLSDLAIYGGAGRGRDGGGADGVDILNWQGVELQRTAVVNFSGIGIHADVVTGSSYKDYLEQVLLEGDYALWNGGAGVQIGTYNVYSNGIETTAVTDSVMENNGGPGLYLAGKAIFGLIAFNNTIQWNNVTTPNPEIEIGYATGADAVQGCSIQSNYVEVDTNGGSRSTSWITANATGCVVINNFLSGVSGSNRTGLNTTSPTDGLTVNGGISSIPQSVAYSTTPSLDLSLSNVQQFVCTSAGASITAALANLSAGEVFTVIFVQNGTTACTWAWPSNVHGGGTVTTTLSGISIQQFVVSANGTDAYAVAAMVNTTGGTP